jgi:IS1 family transposase
MAFHVGDRSRKSAKRLWAKLSLVYRHHATFYTDQYVVYEGVIPATQHRAISKLARQTNHIERFNNTLRQRVSRLVREALSFSKKLANHICNGLQSKWVGPAISGNWGPHSLQQSPRLGQDSVQLRPQSAASDGNPSRQDHIMCN